MTSLESKFKELGYKYSKFKDLYYKKVSDCVRVEIYKAIFEDGEPLKARLYVKGYIYDSGNVIWLAAITSGMENDLKILKECEK